MRFLIRRIPAAIAIMVVVAVAAVAAASASPSITAPRVLHLVSPGDQTQTTYIDLGDPGGTPGDLLVFSGPALNQDKTKTVGRIDGHCVFTEVDPVTSVQLEDCVYAVSLKGGQITVQGTFNLISTVNYFAISGGTGTYQNVRGQDREVLDENQTDSDITLWLIP
jgi:hypothetical protein